MGLGPLNGHLSVYPCVFEGRDDDVACLCLYHPVQHPGQGATHCCFLSHLTLSVPSYWSGPAPLDMRSLSLGRKGECPVPSVHSAEDDWASRGNPRTRGPLSLHCPPLCGLAELREASPGPWRGRRPPRQMLGETLGKGVQVLPPRVSLWELRCLCAVRGCRRTPLELSPGRFSPTLWRVFEKIM